MKKLFFGYHFPMQTYWDTYNKGGITQLSLDFSSRCNYGCDWCFNKHLLNRPEPDVLTLDERVELIRQAARLNAKTLVVPGTGEPTLDPYFMETLRAAHSAGLITVVYSNLTGNVDQKKLRAMKDLGVSIGVKLDSFSEEYFIRRYHTTANKFREYMMNLESVVDVYANSWVQIGEDRAYRLVANMVLTKENAGELEKISGFCKKRDLPLFVRPVKPVLWASKSPELWRKIGNQSGGSGPEAGLVALAGKYNDLFSPSSTLENHCAIYSFGLTVKSNGDVQLCPDHHGSRGVWNIRKDSLKDVIVAMNQRRTIKPGFCVMLPK